MKIGDLAKRAGINIQTVRFYERELVIREPLRTPSGYRQYTERHRWPLLDRASVRCVFLQRVVEPIFMMVVHIVTQDPTEMFLIERYHVVQNLAAATSDPTLGYPVLPGRPHSFVSAPNPPPSRSPSPGRRTSCPYPR